MNKIILSSIVFSFMFLTNIFATNSLKIQNKSKEDIKYELKDCFIRPKGIKSYSGKVRAGEIVFITDKNVVSTKDLKVWLVSDESKTKSFGALDFPDNANQVLEINYIPETQASEESDSATKEDKTKSFWNKKTWFKKGFTKKIEPGFSLDSRSK
ncbi:MAG: hypothetical protein SZ59_C0002G0055 [candidate division TM6 bacterium GW2011_GWF2_28_16]|nr:MAG: hypothetical protein SZ59_C0002G0055 [candidate division TM6 bacterium GW2011_GWF2_28_16]